MMLLSVNGISRVYLKMICQFKMVSWLHNQPDSVYLLILKLKVKTGLLKNSKMILILTDQYVTKLILNLKISSLNSV